jgi:hypothetical protein
VAGAGDDTYCAPGFNCLPDTFALTGYSCMQMCRVGQSCPGGLTCYALTYGGVNTFAGPYQIGVCDL